ncbi:MAG: DNA polymerase [Patescibacteria group bacterium]|nr:DNA polymerase [Patescibacteria group bacterium]
MKTLVLLDTHAIIHRAYHALPDFINSKGEPTGALYGLATMTFKIINNLNPDYIVACYDLPQKTFRHEAYDDYKAGRGKTDDELISQIIKSREFFNAFNIPYYEVPGFEADDLLGTIAEKANKDLKIYIASGDMDTLQLVKGDRVCVYTLKKGINDTIIYNEKAVIERFNFKPKFLPDYKGLRGDPSDNIIGIKGIGDKTATILISKYGTIEKLYKEIKKSPEKVEVSERILNLLIEGEEEALFSKTLATIRKDAPVKFKLPKKNWKEEINPDKTLEFFKDLEFKSLQNRFKNLLDIKEEKKEIKVDDKVLKKAKIAYWLLNSEKTNPDLDDFIDYKRAKNLNEALAKMEEEIERNNLSYVYKEIELPIISIIKKMENKGVLIDKSYFKKISKEYHKELNKIKNKIYKYAGREFNINSPKQLGEILFDELKIPAKIKKTAGGSRSTRESELEKMKELNPIVAEILKYRELQKLLSTYLDSIPKLVSSDGRLHAKFIQTGTTTGRFSSNNPNLQNIPTKDEIRRGFIVSKNHVLVAFDYSQIELRIAALLSQDSYFLDAFNKGNDIHSVVAKKVFKTEDVTSDMRRRAKVINFGILYGMGVTALQKNLGGTRTEAKKFYDDYFAQFPTIKEYLESVKEFVEKNGFTETLFGRKRYFPGIKSKIPFIKAMAERMAINAPIQGTATADIIKIGMKNVEIALIENKLIDRVHLVLQVHDELIYEIEEGFEEEAIEIIKKVMVDVIPKDFTQNLDPVPLEVSVKMGSSWGNLK